MVARNDITGDAIQTKNVSNAYRDNYDLIFGKKKKTENEIIDEVSKLISEETLGDTEVDK